MHVTYGGIKNSVSIGEKTVTKIEKEVKLYYINIGSIKYKTQILK